MTEPSLKDGLKTGREGSWTILGVAVGLIVATLVGILADLEHPGSLWLLLATPLGIIGSRNDRRMRVL